VLRAITRFREANTSVVLPFIMPPREKTMGWNGRLLLGRWRTVVGGRVEVLVDQPGRVAVLIRKARGKGILACHDNRETSRTTGLVPYTGYRQLGADP
jgi:hypothetical protein